jgi:hypothetical protein
MIPAEMLFMNRITAAGKGIKPMKNFAKKLSLVFAAGCLGGVLNSLTVWFFGDIGLTSAAGVKLAPALTLPWLYPRIIWGGIWGLLFLLPMPSDRVFSRGLILSIGPSLVQLFVIFPMIAHKGLMGMELGVLTPVFVLFYNAVWGVAASIWMRWVSR